MIHPARQTDRDLSPRLNTTATVNVIKKKRKKNSS